MAVGKPSGCPCVVCGQHKGNIVEPVSMHTKCLDHRQYFTKQEKISKVIREYVIAMGVDSGYYYEHKDGSINVEGSVMPDELAKKIIEAL